MRAFLIPTLRRGPDLKISCSKEDLGRGLGMAAQVVSHQTALPVTKNVLIESDGPKLKLSATNLTMGLICWTGADVHEEGDSHSPRQTAGRSGEQPSRRKDNPGMSRGLRGA